MAYSKSEILQEALDAIEKHKVLFVDDVVAYVSCSRSTFYEYFPSTSDELDKIKELLTKNKIQIKSSLRAKWYKGQSFPAQLALYKLSATQDELKKLSMTHQDVNHSGSIETKVINLGNGDPSEE